MVGQLRVNLAQHPGDPRGTELLDTMGAADAKFRALWQEHSIGAFQAVRKRLRHPTLGEVGLDYTKLNAASDNELSMVAFLPADEESAAKLERLRGP